MSKEHDEAYRRKLRVIVNGRSTWGLIKCIAASFWPQWYMDMRVGRSVRTRKIADSVPGPGSSDLDILTWSLNVKAVTDAP